MNQQDIILDDAKLARIARAGEVQDKKLAEIAGTNYTSPDWDENPTIPVRVTMPSPTAPTLPQSQPITATSGIKVPSMDEVIPRQKLADVTPPVEERGFGEPPLTEQDLPRRETQLESIAKKTRGFLTGVTPALGKASDIATGFVRETVPETITPDVKFLMETVLPDILKSPGMEGITRVYRPFQALQEAKATGKPTKSIIEDMVKEVIPEAYGLPSGYWDRKEPQETFRSLIQMGYPPWLAVWGGASLDVLADPTPLAPVILKAGKAVSIKALNLARETKIPIIEALSKIEQETGAGLRTIGEKMTPETLSRPMTEAGTSLERGAIRIGKNEIPNLPIKEMGYSQIGEETERLEKVLQQQGKGLPEKVIKEPESIATGKLPAGKVKPPATTPEIGILRQAETLKTPKPSITTTEQGLIYEKQLYLEQERVKTTPEIPPIEKPPVPTPEPGNVTLLPDAPHLGMIEKALSGVEPHRALLGKDPYSAEVARLSREAVLNQSNLYKSLTSENKVFTKLGKSVDTEKMISLYEKGIAENAPELAKLSASEQQYIGLLQTYEKRALDMAVKAGKDPTHWRFVGKYYPRLWEGSHKIITVDAKGVESIANIAKNRAEGIRTIAELAKKNPDKNYILMPRWENLKPQSLPTGLTQQGYWKLVKEISNEMGMSVNEVLEEVSMQGIARIKTPKTKIGNWLYRKGGLEGYIKDPVQAYNTLFYKLSKKVAMEPPLRRASGLLGKIRDPQLRQYASELIDGVGGKYTPSPLSSKITGSVMSVEANLKMGYRPVAAGINAAQQLYSLGIVDAVDVVNATKLLNSPEWKVISEKIGVTRQPALYAGQETARAITPIYHPLGLFSAAETMNRTTVPALGYTLGMRLPLKEINKATAKGIRKFAAQEELAVSFARDFNTAINYDYTKADIMRFKRGGVGKTLLQFKDYPANHISNTIAVMRGKPLPGLERYFPHGLTRGQAIQQATVHFGMMLTQGGLKAVSFGTVTLLPAVGIVWMAKNIPAVLYGTPALLGADVSRASAVEVIELIPDERWELLGATGGDIKRIKEATVYFLQGKNKEGSAKLAQLSPALSRVYKAIDAEANNGIMKVYKAGKMKFLPGELAMYGAGVTPLRMAQGQEGYKTPVKVWLPEDAARVTNTQRMVKLLTLIKNDSSLTPEQKKVLAKKIIAKYEGDGNAR